MRAHIDTDLIIPAEFLRTVSKKGLGKHLFHYMKDSPLDQYQGAQIMAAGENFGCGSSREHAAWALFDWGIRVILAPSFADIFYQNALNNQMLPIVLAQEVLKELLKREKITVDLQNQRVEDYPFSIDPYKKECLLNGMDDLDYLLSRRFR